MIPKRAALLVGAAMCLNAGIAGAQNQAYWIAIDDANELRALHSNKTHKVVGPGQNEAYYRADGSALFVSANARTARTWEIRGNDRVCYSGERFPGCRRFQRSRTNPAELHVTHEDGWDVLVRVEDGIPQF